MNILFQIHYIALMINMLGVKPQHNFHSSLAEMNYNNKSKSFQVVLKLFADDTEAALTKYSGRSYSVGGLGKNRNPDAVLSAYLNEHFILTKKNKKSSIQYIGKEVNVDMIVVYFEIPFNDNLKNYTLSNTIMLDLFDDQNNIVNLQKDNKNKSFQFDSNKKSIQLTNIW